LVFLVVEYMNVGSVSDDVCRCLSLVSDEIQTSDLENLDDYIRGRLNELTEFNWTWIGKGSGRLVYTHESTNNAFKISRPYNRHRSDGVIQNTVEVFAYNELIRGSEYEELFLPVVDFDRDFLWVSMPEGERVNDGRKIRRAANRVHRKVNWLDRFDVSAETRQFVYWNGSIRLADYGQFTVGGVSQE
jgi:hypothetical protein